MTKRYTILQKKQKELESQLNQVLSLPPDTPHHQRFSQEIQQLFLFFKTLLSAEIASHPRKPSHLKHIQQWLLEREADFHEWDSYRSSPLSDDDREDKVSNCSCTESCLNDDGDAMDPDLSELISLTDLERAAEASTELTLAAGLDFDGFDDQDNVENVPEHEPVEENHKSTDESVCVVEATKRSAINKDEETNGSRLGKCLTPWGSGVMIGMAVMAAFMATFPGFFDCYDQSSDYTFSFTPT